jgi:putative membrane protein
MMYPYGEHMSGWGYALGIIGMVLFWAVLVLAIAAAVRYLDRKRGESFRPRPLPRRPRRSRYSPNGSRAARSTPTSTASVWTCCAGPGVRPSLGQMR